MSSSYFEFNPKVTAFNQAVARVHDKYGIHDQFTVDGTTVDNFMLLPRTDRGYDATDMQNLSGDIDFLTEVIKSECA